MKRLTNIFSSKMQKGIIALLSSALLLVACVAEKAIEETTVDTDEKSVLFKVAVPHAESAGTATRAIGLTQENTIETLDVLAFKVENGVETFQYRASATKSGGNTEGNRFQSFNVTLRVKNYAQRFVLITNAQNQMEEFINGRIDQYLGQEKEAMLQHLLFDLKNNDRWNAISAAHYTAIPMWGESETKTINANTGNISENPIQMLRMVAKIEVELDRTVPGLTDQFKLKSVHLYNTNSSGRIVPKNDVAYIGTDKIARKASLPQSVTTIKNPIKYDDFTAPGIENMAMRGAIYLFETAAKNAGDFLQETCIVVGGYYGNDTKESYYRLDFLDTDGITHLDILRNNQYICNIVSVGARGESSVDNAFRSKSFNMKANIVVWNEGTSIVDIPSQYFLNVSKNVFHLEDIPHTEQSTENVLNIRTNCPNGWTAAVWANKAGTQAADWLSTNLSASTNNSGTQPDQVRLLAAANSGDERTAYIHIKAENLTYIITVTQAERLRISAAPQSIWLSPTSGNVAKTIRINGSHGWTLHGTAPQNAALSAATSGERESYLTLTRSDENFGQSVFMIRDNYSGESIPITVENLYLANDELVIGNAHSVNTLEHDVVIEGGSKTFTIVNHSTWIQAIILPNGKLQLTAGQSPNEEERTGFITLAHADDPAYQVRLEVTQSLNILPAFDYLVVYFEWSKGDVDVLGRFFENDVYFDDVLGNRRYVGFGASSNVTQNTPNPGHHLKDKNGNGLLFWGGDAVKGQGETIYFNAPLIYNDDSLPRYIKLQIYAAWYHNIESVPVKVTMNAYVGGRMSHNGVTNFINNGGTSVYDESFERRITTSVTSQPNPPGNSDLFTNGRYTHICDITYDRVKHSAKVEWKAAQ